MPKKSSFRYYDLNQATRRPLDISQFGGVDFSSQQFLIGNGRAIDLKNFVYRDGVVQKRNGVNELYQIESFKYLKVDFDTNTITDNKVLSNGLNFNGIWHFRAEDNQEHIVAHIGKLLFEITDILDNDKIEIKPIYTIGLTLGDDLQQHYGCYEFEDYRSCAYVSGNKLWFQGGNKYMCLRYTSSGVALFPVENSDFTPIPTTTISITYQNANTNNRASLDRVNLLTMWRKNKLISGVGKNETEKNKTQYYDYTLDSPLLVKNEKDMIEFSVQIEERGEIE